MYVPLTRIQKLIGRRMLKSKLSKPCCYMETKADVTELMAIRPRLRKSLGIKITTNTFYIHALAVAVQEYPLMAGRLSGENIEIADHVNVGFAVNAPQGLVVPVIKDAGKKTLPEIALEEKLLTDKARDNQLSLEDIEGETVALSNLGQHHLSCGKYHKNGCPRGRQSVGSQNDQPGTIGRHQGNHRGLCGTFPAFHKGPSPESNSS